MASPMTKKVKIRSLILRDWEERGFLEGRITQIRRIVKPQPQPNGGAGLHPVRPYLTPSGRWNWVLAATGMGGDTFPCPYGTPGDVLCGKEAFGRLRYAVHMPQWASRLSIRNEGVRVERVKDISEADALASIAIDPPENVPAKAVYLCQFTRDNGAAAYDANPWVWALSLSKVGK